MKSVYADDVDRNQKAARGHGTAYGYSVMRCRRACCRRAWAEYMADRRRNSGGPTSVDREVAQIERELDRLDEDADARIPVRLSPLALQILAHVQRQTQEPRGEIVDRLLREHGPELTAA